LALLVKGLPIRITTAASAATITFTALFFIIFFFYILRCCDEKNLWRQAIALGQMNGGAMGWRSNGMAKQ
jgi:uncharacterized membrane protein YfcA